MEPKRTLHSGNLVRGVHAGDRKLFMEKYYDPEKYMELGTCFVREDGKVFILLRDDRWRMGGRKMNQKTQQEGYRNFNLKSLTEAEERFIKKLVDAEVASKPIVAGGELLDFKDRGQRRKLQLYGDNGERES